MLSHDEKNGHVWIHEDQHSPIAREQGAGSRAGLFLLGGRVHVVGRTSPAERRLLEQGAIHFADLCFERPRAEGVVPVGGSPPLLPAPDLRVLPAGKAVEAFLPNLRRN